MESVLVVSGTDKSTSFFLEILTHDAYEEVITVKNGNEARRLLIERDFDLCLINSPLMDEFGTDLAMHFISKGISQVIFLVKSELYDDFCMKIEEQGVFVLTKPVNKQILWNTLKMAGAAYSRMLKLKQENLKLAQRIEELGIVSKAKCLLIEQLKMTENDAHRFIEKQAMDRRITKRQFAMLILDSYESGT